jgi:hypothetical protein
MKANGYYTAMLMKVSLLICAAVLTMGTECALSRADSPRADEQVETGRLLVILLDAGRMTLAENQPLINDKQKGNKGFTPEVFERQAAEHFKQRAGIDLSKLAEADVPASAKRLLPELVKAGKKTVADMQHIINLQGIGFKGFIPAVFGTTTAATFRSYTDVYLRQTMNPARNLRNAPDEFEVKMLARFAEPSYPRHGDQILSEVVDGGAAVRVMLPLYYQKACLACHGEPKGEKDVSGYAKEGAKEGHLGGAISVKVDRR